MTAFLWQKRRSKLVTQCYEGERTNIPLRLSCHRPSEILQKNALNQKVLSSQHIRPLGCFTTVEFLTTRGARKMSRLNAIALREIDGVNRINDSRVVLRSSISPSRETTATERKSSFFRSYCTQPQRIPGQFG